MKEKTGEDLKKKYVSLTKKISTEDLKDMLIILYSEPTLVINNPDFDQLSKQEKENYAKKSARMGLLDDEHKREKLLLRLKKDFHIFDEEKITNPLLEETPEPFKHIIEPTVSIFPKASLLIEIIKSTLNLRETGREFSDDQKINLIECFTSDHSENDYKIVINEDYNHPLNVSKAKNIWRLFKDLVQNGYLNRDNETKRIYDYLNFNPNNLIKTNTKYPLQPIIKQNNNNYEPLFKSAIYTEKALVQRQTKIKHST